MKTQIDVKINYEVQSVEFNLPSGNNLKLLYENGKYSYSVNKVSYGSMNIDFDDLLELLNGYH